MPYATAKVTKNALPWQQWRTYAKWRPWQSLNVRPF